MVKQKKVKRVLKNNKKIKRNKSPDNSAINRKDFEAFKIGIQRLKELKGELDSLDTRGFSKEEQAIRAKLKNVSEIANIEKGIKILKLKINKKYHPRRKKPSRTKEIQKDIKDIKKKLPKTKKIREDIKDIKEDIPELKTEIEKLGEKFSKSKRKNKAGIDSGIGMLVDTDFNNFLSHIKTSLSERVRAREKEVDDTLTFDLQKREIKFKDKYLNLIREFNEKKRKVEKEFNEKYAVKLKTSLQKEVSEKFDTELQRKLDSEKIKLSKVYVAELKNHAREKLNKEEENLKNKLSEEFSKRFTFLEKKYGKKMEQEEHEEKMLQKSKQDFTLQKEEEKNKIKEKLSADFHKKLEDELSKKEKILRSNLSNEFELKLEKQIREHEEKLKERKLNLELEMQKKIKQVLS